MKTLLGLALALCSASAVRSQDALPDPTRPPSSLQAEGAASAPAPADALVLQAVLIGAGRAPAAIIGGQLVALGAPVGEMRLARVSEHGVELQGPQGRTTLRLTPEVNKRARPAAALNRKPPQGAEPKP